MSRTETLRATVSNGINRGRKFVAPVGLALGLAACGASENASMMRAVHNNLPVSGILSGGDMTPTPKNTGIPSVTSAPTNIATRTASPTRTPSKTYEPTETPTYMRPHTATSTPTIDVKTPTRTATASASATEIPTCKPECDESKPTPTATIWTIDCGTPTAIVAQTATAAVKTPEATAETCVPAEDIADILALARANWPYDAIVAFDGHPAKVDHPVGGFTLSAADRPGTKDDETQIFWTGRYNTSDITDGGKTATISRDGLTGIFALEPGNDITVSSPAGSLCVTGLDVDSHDVTTSGKCAPKAEVVNAINIGKTRTDGQIYVNLDEIANRYPNARLRADFAPDTILAGGPLTRLIWIQENRITGSGVMPIDIRMGIGAYLLTENNQVIANWPHSGIITCDPVDPKVDFPWWGR